jgi:hypothetical protein
LGISQNESFHPKLESQPSPNENPESQQTLALQLPFCFEVRALGDGLVSSAPKGPCDGVCGLNPLSIKSDGNAANFLD